MINKKLSIIEDMIGSSSLDEKYYDLAINGVSKDTRTIGENQLYIPIKGESFDGHDFLDAAIENGAIATLWDKSTPVPNMDFPFILVDDTLLALQKLASEYRSSLPVKVIGITGSNGKTSTKDILASILGANFKTHKTNGNYNNHIGVPLTILNMDEDTEYAVIEMGISAFGDMKLLSEIAKPNFGIVTNISEVHIEDLINKENIAKAKMEFLENFGKDNAYFYFADDETLENSRKDLSGDYDIFKYGSASDSDYLITDVNYLKDSSSFKLNGFEYTVPLIGKHQVLNGAAAISVASFLGLSHDQIEKGLVHIDFSKLRNEIMKGENFTILNDAYKSNVDSALASLDTLYSLDGYSQKIVIFGGMVGMFEKSTAGHNQVGRAITDEVDYLFTVGELADDIASEAIKALGKDRVFTFAEKNDVYKKVLEVVKDDAIILIKASRFFELETVADDLLNK